jgi:hypothetical protein
VKNLLLTMPYPSTLSHTIAQTTCCDNKSLMSIREALGIANNPKKNCTYYVVSINNISHQKMNPCKLIRHNSNHSQNKRSNDDMWTNNACIVESHVTSLPTALRNNYCIQLKPLPLTCHLLKLFVCNNFLLEKMLICWNNLAQLVE